jgi:hypothetical protein
MNFKREEIGEKYGKILSIIVLSFAKDGIVFVVSS